LTESGRNKRKSENNLEARPIKATRPYNDFRLHRPSISKLGDTQLNRKSGFSRFCCWVLVASISLSTGSFALGGVHSLPTTQPAARHKLTKGSDSTPRHESDQSPSGASNTPAEKITEHESAKNPQGTAHGGPTPQVEVYIPSVAKLIDAARKSRTAEMYRALSSMIPAPSESPEDFDVGAVLSLLNKTVTWPDSSIVFATYTQDREGRPRWALQIDWPLKEVHNRIREILDDENGRRLLKDVNLRTAENDSYRLELPDFVLAYLIPKGDHTIISSTSDLTLPQTVFGQTPPGAEKKSVRKMLVYCRLNLKDTTDEDDQQSASPFAMIGPFNDLRYGIGLNEQGLWSERLNLGWNPLVGFAIKSAVKKVAAVFDCPRDAYLNAAINVQTGGTLAEEIAGLPTGTLDGRIDDEMAVSVVPGTGFLPLPDVYFQFNASGSKRIIASIRKAIEKDDKDRQDEDTPIAWHEITVDGDTVFWKNDADGASGLIPASFRPVIFFEPPDDNQKPGGRRRLIVANTTTAPEDAVQRWLEIRSKHQALERVPSTKDAHWQLTVNWKQIYNLLQPYLAILTSGAEGSGPAPTVEELSSCLADSTIQLKIEMAGLDVRHVGPLPFGAAYVPAVTAMSLNSTGNPGSESERERIACSQLRVLYHHAKLFKADYGRWPANVAELDGYIDFRTHPYLLSLQPKDRSVVGNITSIFTARRGSKPRDDRNGLDDSLYEIDVDASRWKLKIRKNEFVHYETIYINQDGEIKRVALVKKPGDAGKSARTPQRKSTNG
jgi:hypothetical protein